MGMQEPIAIAIGILTIASGVAAGNLARYLVVAIGILLLIVVVA